jgi:hypothetical protein
MVRRLFQEPWMAQGILALFWLELSKALETNDAPLLTRHHYQQYERYVGFDLAAWFLRWRSTVRNWHGMQKKLQNGYW